jgi:aspartate/methionine/tyrosine aminotransferase
VIGEEIALRALKREEELLVNVRATIEGNLTILKEWICDKDWLRWIEPKAGVVCFPMIEKGVVDDPEDLYVLLAEKYKTFVIPGRCFEFDNHFFRIGFGGDPEHLRIGLDNIDQALRELRTGNAESQGTE